MNPEISNILYNFLPELTLSLTIIVINILGLFQKLFRGIHFYVFAAGLALSLIFVTLQANSPVQPAFGGIIVLDHPAYFGKLISIAATLFLSLLLYRKQSSSNEFLLILALALASLAAVSSSQLIMTFASLELMSITVYLLISTRNPLTFRYFLYGSVLSGMMLFGMTLLYGVSGSFDYYQISRYLSLNPFNTITVSISVILIIAGLAFKMYLMPFNFMYPQLSDRLELRTFGIISIPVLTTIFVISLRFFTAAMHDSGTFVSETSQINFIGGVKWDTMLAILGTASVFAGNLVILWQSSLRKIVSFLIIAQSGLVIMGLSAASTAGTEAMLFNAAIFAVSGCGLFYCLKILEEKYGILTIEQLKSLGRRDPVLIVSLLFLLLAIAGFPFTGGFTGRLYLYAAMLNHGLTVSFVIILLSSITLIYFIFRLAQDSFSAGGPSGESRTVTADRIILLMITALVLSAGIFPEPLMGWIRFCSEVYNMQIF